MSNAAGKLEIKNFMHKYSAIFRRHIECQAVANALLDGLRNWIKCFGFEKAAEESLIEQVDQLELSITDAMESHLGFR